MNSAVNLPLDLPELSIGTAAEGLVRRTILPSGVRILTEHIPGSRSATIGYWVAAGSRDELGAVGSTPSRYGATHFLEHLLFKGTPTRTALDIAIAFDSVGGEHNAVTSKEYTCYYAKVRDADLPMAVDVLSDMVTSALLDPVEFETERGVILEELAMAEDDPSDVAGERLFEAVLGGHPLGRPVGGTPEAIRAVTREAVWEHFKAAYRPNDLVISAAGAVDHDELVARVVASLERSEWDLGTPATPRARRSTTPVALDTGHPLTVVTKPTEQASVMVGLPGIVATDDRRTVMAVLNSVFGGGMSSRLFQEVRERRGLAYSVYSYAPSYSDAGIFLMYAGCTPGREGAVTELMLSELRRLADDGITADELRRASGQLSGSAALALEDSDTRMSRLGRSELTIGEFVDLDESVRRLSEVTADDVQQLAGTLLEGSVSIAAVGPITEGAFAATVGA
ncbi:insulinase family protein [Herbiconiux sp. VKM Ac-1786]|uniref:M16 family metallopeptidase n=1 Tax=Herbiconiux sp. VKM Ac-1786 TaxID=2783824 RepID=UPI00188C51D9|nr:pitrilysin family protein [Herbiconiux sp. VKM Ac-1786]MBF4573745.1 insulinase family protein [Herbiconiux sp. VKM Ac-1786]